MNFRGGKGAKVSHLAQINWQIQKEETFNESTPTKRPEPPKGWK
jgi:hypothetical protein